MSLLSPGSRNRLWLFEQELRKIQTGHKHLPSLNRLQVNFNKPFWLRMGGRISRCRAYTDLSFRETEREKSERERQTDRERENVRVCSR
jgi:hypothetical protein